MKKGIIITLIVLISIILIVAMIFGAIALTKVTKGIMDDVQDGEDIQSIVTDIGKIYKNPVATMKIKDYGTVKIELYPDIAPNTVKNFITLSNNGFYDGLTFHRVIENFMIQGGDKNGNGTGNPRLSDLSDNIKEDKEYGIKGEFEVNGHSNSLKHEVGVISMARADYSYYGASLAKEGYNSGGSQFFIMTEDYPSLDGLYASFGKVIEGMDVIDKVEKVEVSGETPIKAPVIESIRVETYGKDYGLPEVTDLFDIQEYISNYYSNYFTNQ